MRCCLKYTPSKLQTFPKTSQPLATHFETTAARAKTFDHSNSDPNETMSLCTESQDPRPATIGAIIIRIGLCGPVCYAYNKEPLK